MALEMCVLGSGSSGNATIVRSPWGVLMIDAGFGPRTTAQRLSGSGLGVNDIAAICLTHLDSDHFNRNWYATLRKQRIRVFCHTECRQNILECPEAEEVGADPRLARLGAPPLGALVTCFDGTAFEPLPGVRLHPLKLAHDRAGSHGFVIECAGVRIGFATDLGHVTPELLERFCGVHILAIESNYDPDMEQNSDRPWFLKRRIMGGAGHLSNGQAFAAVQEILDRTQRQLGAAYLPRHVVLLHRSRQCNCPQLVRELFSRDARIKPILTLAHQFERTAWLSARQHRILVGEQLRLAWDTVGVEA